MTTLYGIKNCDTVKKARKWLEGNSIAYTFHDFREHGLTEQQVNEWLKVLAPEVLINKRSTTWKQMSESDKAKVDAGDIAAIAAANPTLIKRPVLATGDSLQVGFKDSDYAGLLL
ncbi:Spx/MgsR family RNA polymerase-binding regulatory protein [Teredinibacter turnerae]|uniref:Spx/MgsR family RNA polymerase-binding regulatory protein n=1 Tax=Teredinibacter turnerae TaxID=2426 RepID=UPI00035F8992|nr:Spx/MgsR family RNA polymerase-binding regulatory protein [Teredinibacter turnerae]